MSASRYNTAEVYFFEQNGTIPNNPDLPVLVYGGVLSNEDDAAEKFGDSFRKNGWGGFWKSRVYGFHHYHSNVHEALGVISGSAVLLVGGPSGKRIPLNGGDLILLPAGTGHKLIEASADFLVLGAYPEGQEDYDFIKEPSPLNEKLKDNIKSTPKPKTDPVFGRDGPLFDFWYDS